MSTPVPTNPNPFVDPNNALRQFNQYFGDLRKQYGEDAIRQVGFEPKEFQDLQASLRKLQLDPRATPEQHRAAYMQARDTLARRLTTPLEATRSYSVVQQPKPAPSPSVGNDGIVTPMPVERPVMNSPTQEQLYSYARAVGRGETGQWDPTRGVFVMTAQPPQPQGGLTQAAPFDVAAAYRQNSQKLADAVKAGQITVERARQLQAPLFAATKLGSTPEGQAAMNAAAAQAQGGMPMSGYDAAAQYRNFGQELMGMIKSGALTVEQANALKAPVFNAVKLGNSNAGYQQMQAALNAARQQMGGQNMGQSVNPVTPPPPMLQPPEREVIGFKTPPPGVRSGDTRIFADQPVTPPPMAYPGGTPNFNERTGLYTPDNQGLSDFMARFGKLLNKGPGRGIGYRAFDEGVGGGVMPVRSDMPAPQGVGMAPQMPPQAAVAQPASAPQGMAMGGLLRKYYGGGMC